MAKKRQWTEAERARVSRRMKAYHRKRREQKRAVVPVEAEKKPKYTIRLLAQMDGTSVDWGTFDTWGQLVDLLVSYEGTHIHEILIQASE